MNSTHYSRMCSEGFLFYTLGVWRLRCVRSAPLSKVRKSSFEGRFAVPLGSFTGGVFLGSLTCLPPSFRVASVALRDMWTCAWQRVENRFSWQAQCFRNVVQTCVTFFVAGPALWTCPNQFFVAGAALQTCRVACFSHIALARLRAVATTCKFRGRRGIS